jgi:hypothetical protein
MRQHEQAILLVKKAADDEALLEDARQPLPAALADLDMLTPSGTLFCYEDLPVDGALDRRRLFKMVVSLREFVRTRLS